MVIKTPIWERIVQKVQVPERITRSVPYTEMRTVARTRMLRIPVDYAGQILDSSISSWPIVESSVVTAGAVGTSGSVTPAADTFKVVAPVPNKEGTDVTSKKLELGDEELPSKKEPGTESNGLYVGPPSGNGASNKSAPASPPASGKIRLRDVE